MVLVMLMMYLFSLVMWVCNVGFGMNLYLSNQVLIKFDQLKLLNRFWPSCHIIPNTC
jgi:hypothetical protein